MSPKSSKPEITVVGELPTPEPRTTPPARHWITVAAKAMEHEGQWLMIRVPHLKRERHRQVVSDIRKGNIFAFRWPGFSARYVDGDLYVRYDEQDETVAPTPLRKVI